MKKDVIIFIVAIVMGSCSSKRPYDIAMEALDQREEALFKAKSRQEVAQIVQEMAKDLDIDVKKTEITSEEVEALRQRSADIGRRMYRYYISLPDNGERTFIDDMAGTP